jgi:SAM-dependent methyltransferase
MSRSLTSQKFWKNYWSDDKVALMLNKKPKFSEIIQELTDKDVNSFIEIGGFPGVFAFYVKKNLKIESTLLDSYIDKNKLKKVANFYGIKIKDVNIIKADFLKYNSKKKYDLVFSSGFIEHFENLQKIIRLHLNLLNEGGKLLITVPNFLGLNGYLQKKFDPSNYKAHNLKAMDINELQKILRKFGVKKSKVYYYGYSGVWFENLEEKPFYLKFLVYSFYILKTPLGLFNINSKLLSPHIVIEAIK